LHAAAFRKQLSRARRLFTELLVVEVARTLGQPTPEQVKQELIDVGLWRYIQDYLPTRGPGREALADPC
jgi:hypothetical protein